MACNEPDVRELRKPDKHPTIFETFGAPAVSDSFVLVNNHDPKHLRQEFDTRKRVIMMRRTFRRHRKHVAAVAIVAHKPATGAGPSARPAGDKRL